MEQRPFSFLRAIRAGARRKRLDEKDIEAYLAYAKEYGIETIVAHAPYTLNACSADAKVREFAKEAMTDDLRRMEYLPGNVYNFHPGSHVGQGIERGIEMIADLLNEILTSDLHTTVLLETMAGKGSEVGSRFEEIAEIISRVECKDKMASVSIRVMCMMPDMI